MKGIDSESDGKWKWKGGMRCVRKKRNYRKFSKLNNNAIAQWSLYVLHRMILEKKSGSWNYLWAVLPFQKSYDGAEMRISYIYICRPVPQMWKFLWKWKIESESHIVNQFPRCHQFNFFTVGGRIPFCQIETSLSKVLSNLMFTGRLHDSCSRWRASPRYLLAKG